MPTRACLPPTARSSPAFTPAATTWRRSWPAATRGPERRSVRPSCSPTVQRCTRAAALALDHRQHAVAFESCFFHIGWIAHALLAQVFRQIVIGHVRALEFAALDLAVLDQQIRLPLHQPAETRPVARAERDQP